MNEQGSNFFTFRILILIEISMVMRMIVILFMDISVIVVVLFRFTLYVALADAVVRHAPRKSTRHELAELVRVVGGGVRLHLFLRVAHEDDVAEIRNRIRRHVDVVDGIDEVVMMLTDGRRNCL